MICLRICVPFLLINLFIRSLPVRMNFNLEHLQETDHKPANHQLRAGSVWPQNELEQVLRPHLQLIREQFLGMLCLICKILKASLIINPLSTNVWFQEFPLIYTNHSDVIRNFEVKGLKNSRF